MAELNSIDGITVKDDFYSFITQYFYLRSKRKMWASMGDLDKNLKWPQRMFTEVKNLRQRGVFCLLFSWCYICKKQYSKYKFDILFNMFCFFPNIYLCLQLDMVVVLRRWQPLLFVSHVVAIVCGGKGNNLKISIVENDGTKSIILYVSLDFYNQSFKLCLILAVAFRFYVDLVLGIIM